MSAWRGLTPAAIERLFAAHPDVLAVVVAWIDAHPELDTITTPED